MHGKRSRASVLTVKARVPQQANYSPILPVVIPDLGEVKAFANHLHTAGKHWHGEIFGWPDGGGRYGSLANVGLAASGL